MMAAPAVLSAAGASVVMVGLAVNPLGTTLLCTVVTPATVVMGPAAGTDEVMMGTEDWGWTADTAVTGVCIPRGVRRDEVRVETPLTLLLVSIHPMETKHYKSLKIIMNMSIVIC